MQTIVVPHVAGKDRWLLLRKGYDERADNFNVIVVKVLFSGEPGAGNMLRIFGLVEKIVISQSHDLAQVIRAISLRRKIVKPELELLSIGSLPIDH